LRGSTRAALLFSNFFAARAEILGGNRPRYMLLNFES